MHLRTRISSKDAGKIDGPLDSISTYVWAVVSKRVVAMHFDDNCKCRGILLSKISEDEATEVVKSTQKHRLQNVLSSQTYVKFLPVWRPGFGRAVT